MKPGSRYQIDMTHGPLFSKIVLFSVPLMFSTRFFLDFYIFEVILPQSR